MHCSKDNVFPFSEDEPYINFFHGFKTKKCLKLVECDKHDYFVHIGKMYILSKCESVFIITGVRAINGYNNDVAKRSYIQFLFLFFFSLPYSSTHTIISHLDDVLLNLIQISGYHCRMFQNQKYMRTNCYKGEGMEQDSML